jgi:hypothetical protein
MDVHAGYVHWVYCNPFVIVLKLMRVMTGKHVPMFNSKLLGKGVLVGKFASDTSHIEQYAAIARESMERFVSTIAPFRCSAAGARASGLRKPVKPCTREKSNRSFTFVYTRVFVARGQSRHTDICFLNVKLGMQIFGYVCRQSRHTDIHFVNVKIGIADLWICL